MKIELQVITCPECNNFLDYFHNFAMSSGVGVAYTCPVCGKKTTILESILEENIDKIPAKTKYNVPPFWKGKKIDIP